MEDIFDRAVVFAVRAHAGQLRKVSGEPYILHPMEAAAIVGTLTCDREILAAAVLHDTVEDTDVTPEDIRNNFGERVYELVMHETEDKREDRPPSDTWRVRKEESLLSLANCTDAAVKMMWLGDKLSNMRSFTRAYGRIGGELFLALNAHDPKDHKWYYGRIAELLSELSDSDAYREYCRLYHELFDRY